MRDRTPNRPVVLAAVAASCWMLSFGLAYRVLAAQLGAPVRSRAPVEPAALARLPRAIDAWTGEDVPLDEAIVRKTGSDVYLNRRYVHRSGTEAVGLYLASGVKARTLVSHRPEICYLASGWLLEKQWSAAIPLSGATRAPCTIFEFSRGGLNTAKMVVLNYFVVDGQYYGDVATLQAKAGRRLGMVDYAAQVQISSSETLSTDSALRVILDFAAACAPSVMELFQDGAQRPSDAASCQASEGG